MSTNPASPTSKKGIKSLKAPQLSAKRRKTYSRMLRSIILAAVVVVAILIILQLLGINVSSMLAGVGIASIVIGFALQDAMKDIFRGLEIVNGGYYNIGDIIKFGDNYGQVLSITLRTTRIQDYNSMNIVSIANRDIDKVELVSEYIYITVPLPLRIKPSAANLLMDEITANIANLSDVTSATSQGVAAISNYSLNYQIQLTCDPTLKLRVRRAALGEVVATLAARKVPLPVEQFELMNRKTKS